VHFNLPVTVRCQITLTSGFLGDAGSSCCFAKFFEDVCFILRLFPLCRRSLGFHVVRVRF